MKSIIIAAALSVATLAAVPALAADDANACQTLAAQTNAALGAASTDVSEARGEARQANQACQFGHFKMGVTHYQKALALLGK
jgi:hypothetical protein